MIHKPSAQHWKTAGKYQLKGLQVTEAKWSVTPLELAQKLFVFLCV